MSRVHDRHRELLHWQTYHLCSLLALHRPHLCRCKPDYIMLGHLPTLIGRCGSIMGILEKVMQLLFCGTGFPDIVPLCDHDLVFGSEKHSQTAHCADFNRRL
jgi:hypothetical protein